MVIRLPLALTAVAFAAAIGVPTASGAEWPSGGPAAVVDPERPAAAAPPLTASPPTLSPLSFSAPGFAGRAPLDLRLELPPTLPRPGFVWPLRPRPSLGRLFAPGPYRWSPGHRGVDLHGSAGQEVLAVATGQVAFAGTIAGRGVITIDHGDRLRTTYEPVDRAVARGDTVAAGQVLGTLQAAGSHCPPTACLHLGALLGEDYIDPLSLLRRYPPVLLSAPPPPQR